MKICFVLDRPELGGGVKVVFQLAELARRMGNPVEILGVGSFPTWGERYYRGPYLDWSSQGETARRQDYDLAIGTYFTSFELLRHLRARRKAHLCQGFEGDLEHLADRREEIESVYRLPHPLLTVNPALGYRMSRLYGKEWHFVPPPLDPLFRPSFRMRPGNPVTIGVPGVFEAPVKGVRQCLDAVASLKAAGSDIRVWRFSTLPLSEEERGIHRPDRYACNLAPKRIARWLRRCDLLLFGSHPGEGFGLPVLEAAASGVPVVGNDLPALRLVGIPRSQRVPVGDSSAMAEIASRLLRDPHRWRASRRAQLTASRARFHPSSTADRLKAALDSILTPMQ